MNANVTLQLEGLYRVRKYKAATDELVQDTGEFKNVITDQGLARWGGNNFCTHGFVGTGTATPTVSDIQMASYLGFTTTRQSDVQSNSGFPANPSYCQHVITYRFPPGAATGNLTEVGVGYDSVEGTPTVNTHRVSSRARIVDSVGAPVTITVLADEYLDITYTMRLYTPANAPDVTYNIDISGTTYAVTARAAMVHQWSASLLGILGYGSAGYTNFDGFSSGASLMAVNDVVSGGSSDYATLVTRDDVTTTYSGGVLTISQKVFVPLNRCNFAGGLRFARLYMTSGGGGLYTQTQMSFTPAIPKDSTKILRLTFQTTLTRL